MDADEARRRLLAERAATLGQRDSLDESFNDIVENARESNVDDEHDTEGTTIAAERQLVASLGREAGDRLQKVDRALARVDAGTYGICLSCGQPISDLRLEARPASELCIDCARLVE